MKKSKRSAPWLRHYGKTQLSSNIGKKFPWDFDVLMCVLTHENQVGMQITSQFLSFPSTQPLKYLVFTTSATTRSYEKSQWTRVRFPTRREVYVQNQLFYCNLNFINIRSWNKQKYKNNPGKLMVSTRIFSDKHVTCQPLPAPSAKAAVWRCQKGELGEWFRTIWRVEETNAISNHVAS